LLFASELAIGQSSTEPIQRLPEVNLWRPLLGVPLTQTAWAAALVRVGTCYESPVTETPGLQGCLEDHATGTVQNTGPACGRHDREAACRRRKVWKGQAQQARTPPPPSFISQAAATVHYPDSHHYQQLRTWRCNQQSPLDHIAVRGGEDWKGMSCTRAAITWEAVHLTTEGFTPRNEVPSKLDNPP
jgi:hypothetical protein